MDVKAAGESHWQAEIGDELEQIAIPEWGSDVVVYFRPMDTGEDRSAFFKAQNDGSMFDMLYEVFLRKCLREDGSRIWGDGERRKIRTKLSPIVVERIAQEILKRTRKAPSIEAAEGN